jgi:glutamine amidotransferase
MVARAMCRWLSYIGNPVYLEEMIFEPDHSLIDQSLKSHHGAQTTNGDGFGIGWYGSRDAPGVYRSVQPAWNDGNLRDLAAQIQSGLFIAHVRATTGTAVQQSNCHPFRHGRWIFVHNGLIRGFPAVKRELATAVDPELYPMIEGTTDSEIMFHLALTFGLADDAVGAVERMAGFVERIGRGRGVEHPLNMTLGFSDGTRLLAVRYSSERSSRSLFTSRNIEAFREVLPRLERLSNDTRAIVSEPLGRFTDFWQEVPESTAVAIEDGRVETRPFTPAPP